MTFAFALLAGGLLVTFAGVRGRSVLDILRGVTDPIPGPGEGTSFASSTLDLANTAVGGLARGLGATAAPGLTTWEGTRMCTWIARELQQARENGWQGSVISGYRSNADQARACAQGPGPCASPGQSNHQGKAYPSCAVDVTDPFGLARALPSGSPLKHTGPSIDDDPHFSSGLQGV